MFLCLARGEEEKRKGGREGEWREGRRELGHEVSDDKAHSLHISQVVVLHNCNHHTPPNSACLKYTYHFTPQGKPAGSKKDRRIYSLSPKNKGYILSPFKASQALFVAYLSPPPPVGVSNVFCCYMQSTLLLFHMYIHIHSPIQDRLFPQEDPSWVS